MQHTVCMCIPRHTQLTANSSPTWHTVPLFLKVDVTSFLFPAPPPLRIRHSSTPCVSEFSLSVCLFDELSGLIHLPEFLHLIHPFDVTVGVYFGACYTGTVVVKKEKKGLLLAKLNFSCAPRRSCLKYMIFVVLCLQFFIVVKSF